MRTSWGLVASTICFAGVFWLSSAGVEVVAQSPQNADNNQTQPDQAPRQRRSRPRPARSSEESKLLRGKYGPERANNDLLYYYLDVRIDPARRTVSGKNTIRFKMLEDGSRIQIDLRDILRVDGISFANAELEYERQADSIFIDFPHTLEEGKTYSIEVSYSGKPTPIGRFGSLAFEEDPAGRPWVYTACEEEGGAMWWPCKDQWCDEVESMDISVAVPNGLTGVSNGRLVGSTDLGDGFTRWDWRVSYPINCYCVSLNIGSYVHFEEDWDDLTLDYYVLPEALDKAKSQFVQVRSMLEAFEHHYGEYPFKRDGYKLIHVPYTGMEHQSAVTYGNGFRNGFVGRGAGAGLKFDFIIIHESGHEWFGNAVSAADRADMWIHEGWTNYLESVYVEYHFGYAEAMAYLNHGKRQVANRRPVVGERGVYATPPGDQYKKGSLFLNTLRSVVNDDTVWWKLQRDFFQRFKYKNILTEDVAEFFNAETGLELAPIFEQYLRHAAIPVLELRFDEDGDSVSYRWQADVEGFAMPVKVGAPTAWQTITPTDKWQSLTTPLSMSDFQVATNLYYIEVEKE
ncbi:Aminopeptidase N [Posidoniimonas corsicana]|uniref:Aminopeptidase N n=1 Tax=Posidoniimonas corsicana TaxID=1938618 RepID=A0A5C5VBW4_9BACT|nr:M1 family metallopeptidase [Posidoniimonas corsicana]TWT35433.1 Aminopeptidase N [Posidoniimonas corsicana]